MKRTAYYEVHTLNRHLLHYCLSVYDSQGMSKRDA